MFKSRYSKVLTIILIILIIAIIVITTILSVNAYKKYKEEKDREKAYATLQDDIQEEENTIENNIDINVPLEPIQNATINNNTSSGTTRPKTKFYKNYPMVGYIEIPKTKVKYPILIDISPAALETSVGVMYPSNPSLNEPGNVVIIGHNYRNGQFFSNNKKLVIGDKIKITDLKGRTLTYTIYEISTLPETDTEYITRERGDNIEISISTCTDDGKARLVILARVQ